MIFFTLFWRIFFARFFRFHDTVRCVKLDAIRTRIFRTLQNQRQPIWVWNPRLLPSILVVQGNRFHIRWQCRQKVGHLSRTNPRLKTLLWTCHWKALGNNIGLLAALVARVCSLQDSCLVSPFQIAHLVVHLVSGIVRNLCTVGSQNQVKFSI